MRERAAWWACPGPFLLWYLWFCGLENMREHPRWSAIPLRRKPNIIYSFTLRLGRTLLNWLFCSFNVILCRVQGPQLWYYPENHTSVGRGQHGAVPGQKCTKGCSHPTPPCLPCFYAPFLPEQWRAERKWMGMTGEGLALKNIYLKHFKAICVANKISVIVIKLLMRI